jgi:hypothetical protein
MFIKFKDILVYYLNPDFFEYRRNQMDIYLKNLGFNYERVASTSEDEIRHVRISEGFVKLISNAIEKNVYPFLILEDDARLITSFPEQITIPEEASIIYFGCSLYECGGLKGSVKIEEYNDDYYRLYNSLGCHAILITNKTGAELFLEKQKEAINRKDHGDIYLAVASNKHLILTPKDGPYFYQNDAHTEPITKFLWKDHLDKYLYSCQ